ncbi:MAG: flagellin lysine-N-methylase [Selenomonadaceae bacterium]|nr:flagellin lysine-N-methylase [Selenomonadaceae bacterium]
MEKYLYFQPEYVSRFKCDGLKCPNNCCERPWVIIIDKKTYEQYSRMEPPEAAKEICSHIEYNEPKEKYFLKDRPCPFLTKDKLCGIQLEYGENFLSQTCAIYPRTTHNFGKFFERALTLTCPVAAEMVLFAHEPMKFEFVEVPEKIHSNGGKIDIPIKMPISNLAAELMLEIQIALISILQERTLTIDQRLIVLCFFVDRLEEIYSRGMDADEQRKLIAAYESKKFLTEQVPLMIQSVSFDATKFIGLMMEMFESFFGLRSGRPPEEIRLSLGRVTDLLQIKPDKNNQISISAIAANYERLAGARRKFLAEYSTFLENYLVNELFLNLYPWKDHYRPSRSLSVFLIEYKVFELFVFAATQAGFSGKDDLLKLVDWYTSEIDHGDCFKEKIFAYLEERKDFFELMETLLER